MKIGETFEENSNIKAEAVKRFCDKNNIQKIVVADDAGLLVDALNRKTRSSYSKICWRPCKTGSGFEEIIR